MPLGKSDSERGAETVPCEMCAKVFGFKDFRMVYRGTIDKEWQPAAMGIRVPLSQTLFCVAEVSKQGICPDKCRKTARGMHSFTPPFLL